MMRRAMFLTLALYTMTLVLPGPAHAQQQIQNGKVDVRRATAIDREVASLPPSADVPAWIGWKVPMIDGVRDACSWYTDRDSIVRGMMLDYSTGTTLGRPTRPQIAPETGPVPLEAGTQLVVLLRVLDGRIERLRTIGDDCPIDAQGRTVVWLEGVTPSESLRYLDSLVTMSGDDRVLPLSRVRSSVSQSALSAIGSHRDPGADAILDRLAADARDASLRQSAMSVLASQRGAHGFATLERLLGAERTPDVRRHLATALGQTREAGTVEAMRGLTRDPDAKVRAEAVYYLALRGGPAVAAELLKIIESDADASVKRRAISGVSRWPNAEGVAPLIQLARTSSDPVVRKEAVSALSKSADPRAIVFMEELIKR